MKILFLRFSSIGDIVLTFPVVHAVRDQLPNVEIHFATKSRFRDLLSACQAIQQIHTFDKRTTEIWSDLKNENFDVIIDLHNNIRSRSLSGFLAKRTLRFPKLNFRKSLLVLFQWDLLPNKHLVDRYFEAVEKIGVVNTHQKIKFYIPKKYEVNLGDWGLEPKKYISIALGAQFKTKQLPVQKVRAIIEQIDYPIILLGGKTEEIFADELVEKFPTRKMINFVGKLSILESAYLVKNAKSLLTNDTGLMHIGSCFGIPLHVTWGNTVPKFGMYPYLPEKPQLNNSYEISLRCRPCSKIGFEKCPKGHHHCMMNLDESKIVEAITRELSDE